MLEIIITIIAIVLFTWAICAMSDIDEEDKDEAR
jgi:hypothetical protein